MSDTSEKKWYVVKAISGKEKKVKEYLESEIKRMNLQDLIPTILIPTEKYFEVKNGKKVCKERNYLPGYVLVEAVLVGEVVHVIKNVPNVLGFLGTNGEPDPLRPIEVKRILGKMDELQGMGAGSDVMFMVGQSVIVNDGPFSTFNGIIVFLDRRYYCIDLIEHSNFASLQCHPLCQIFLFPSQCRQ